MNRDNHMDAEAKSVSSKSKLTWTIFIGFLLLAYAIGAILSHWLPAPLAYEISFFSLLINVCLFGKAVTENEFAIVVNMATYFGLYLASDLFGRVMIKPLAIGIAVFLFVLAHERLGLRYLWGGQPVMDSSQVERSLLRSIMRSLIFSIIACALSLLVWLLWHVLTKS